MARPTAAYLFEAFARRKEPENRLTEVLACVLAFDAEFRDRFMDLMLPGRAVSGVETQVATGVKACTMDMRFALTADGTPSGAGASEVWFEHKITQGFGDEQLQDYKTALSRRWALGHEVHLRVIMRTQPNPEDQALLDEMGALVLRWHDVADVIEVLLTTRSPGWYLAAARPGVPVELRILAELAIYLQEVAGVAVTGPFDDEKLGAVENIEAARKVGEQLLERVAETLHPGCHAQAYQDKHDEIWLDVWARGWWNDLNEGWLYLWIAPRTWFAEDAEPVPSFGVSVHVGKEDAAHLTSDGFQAAAHAAKLRHGTYWNTGTAYVSAAAELAGVADLPSLGDQVAVLREFAVGAMKRLAGCVPAGTDPQAQPAGHDPEATLDPSTLS